MFHFSRGATALDRVNEKALICDFIYANGSFSGWNIFFLLFHVFKLKKWKSQFFQKVIQIVYFFTINHRNTLKENEIHNISYCKYIDRV